MFGSTVMEVVIGMAFCYGSLALTVTTLQEALSAAFGLPEVCAELIELMRKFVGDVKDDVMKEVDRRTDKDAKH